MFCKVNSGTICGVTMVPVTIEVDVGDGLPVMEMVGLLNSEVREAKERVRTAIKNMGVNIPPKRITVNLAPADIRKEGGNFDLAIAIGILKAAGKIQTATDMDKTIIVGELGLDGRVNSVRGVLVMADEAKKSGIRRIIVPAANRREAELAGEIEVIAVESLTEACDKLNGKNTADLGFSVQEEKEKEGDVMEDFSDICGQEGLKRAALVAAAGRHNLFIIGPPGSGKTMIASRIGGILPKPDMDECIEITKIYSIAGELESGGLMKKRPFRSPHHTVTTAAMAGGGRKIKPGEITLAHRGVLFLDELAEYKRDAIEVLRQPLENGNIVINRASGIYRFPADIMLVASTNPCKCGYYPDRSRCRCTENDVRKYLGKISGPMLNRMDIMVSAPAVSAAELQSRGRNVSTGELQKKVEAARLIQRERYMGTNIRFNSRLSSGDVKKYCYLGEKETSFMKKVLDIQSVSARSYFKILKVARTIADLDGAYKIEKCHLAEAVGYRPSFDFMGI